jgi:hypothetical protein
MKIIKYYGVVGNPYPVELEGHKKLKRILLLDSQNAALREQQSSKGDGQDQAYEVRQTETIPSHTAYGSA